VRVTQGTRIGLVGCGDWGRHILRDLRSLGCEVTVVARSKGSTARARDGGAAAIVGSVAELPAVDGIVVATPVATHCAVTQAALEHGVPVFVEKPLTADVAEAELLATSSRVFVMDKWRYHPGVEALAEIARGGELGAVLGLRTMRVGWGNPHDVDGVWVLAPHDLAIGLEILGEIPEPRSASGNPNDVVGLLGDQPWLSVTVSTRSPSRLREVVLLCEDGAAALPGGYSDHLLVGRNGAEPERRGISTELPLLRELRAFVEHLSGGPPPRSSVAEGAQIVRVIARLRALAGFDV
jgi:predicted dehydrogenase